MGKQVDHSKRNFLGLMALSIPAAGIFLYLVNNDRYSAPSAATSQSRPYLRVNGDYVDFFTTDTIASYYSFNEFRQYLIGVNPSAFDTFTSMTDKSVILQRLQNSLTGQDQQWSDARQFVASDLYTPRVIQTYNKPRDGGIFIFPDETTRRRRFGIEIDTGV